MGSCNDQNYFETVAIVPAIHFKKCTIISHMQYVFPSKNIKVAKLTNIKTCTV